MTTTTTGNSTALAIPAAEHGALLKTAETGSIDVFSSESAFAGAQRMAKALASSTLVPKDYVNNIPNVLIAMELASRIRASVFAVMQNIDVIHGRPSWRAKFLIATVNACGRFTTIRWRWEGEKGKASFGVRAWAKELSTGEECVGPLISWEVVRAEGWESKSGSKWKTISEKMFMYRSAAWWADLYAPELSLGMRTSEETIDAFGEDVTDAPAISQVVEPSALEAALLAKAPSSPDVNAEPVEAKVEEKAKPVRRNGRQDPPHDAETGEIHASPEREPEAEG